MRPPPLRQPPPIPPVESPRVFSTVFFFTPSSCQVEEVPDVLINLPGTLLTVFFFSSVVSVLIGLCRVPFLSSAGGVTGTGAFNTFAGVLIISRMAKASASAKARRVRTDFKSSSVVSFSTGTAATTV